MDASMADLRTLDRASTQVLANFRATSELPVRNCLLGLRVTLPGCDGWVLSVGEAWAHVGGLLATDLVEVTDLATDPGALDRGGWWAVRADFDGPVTGYRFATVRRQPLPRPASPWPGIPMSAWSSSLDADEYRAGIAAIKRSIEAGDVYQVNLCRLLRAAAPPSAGAAGLATVLATGNPAPHQAVLDTGSDWVVSASPELFLARSGDRLESAPIKGTAAAGEAFAVKDTAENVMIVDLVRNDLNRICRPESVHVHSLLATEAHPGLRHLVSRVRGRLRTGVGWPEIFAAVFPPGSVTGAPKLAALQVIGDLEPVNRQIYCGAIGFVDADRRRAQLAVAIRTFFATSSAAGQELFFGTGAGITYPSDPDAEWAETELKAARLLRLASSGVWKDVSPCHA